MIQSKSDLKLYLKQDAIALGVNKTKWGGVKNLLFPNEIHSYEVCLRKLEYYENVGRKQSFLGKMLWLYYKIKHRRKGIKLGFSIAPNCFGPGLSIPHYGNIVVNSNARIGANCRLHSGVNIGASAGSKEAPYLGDNIYIGPGVILFGAITITDNVTIGANATVNKSCEEQYVVLAGSPASIVKRNMDNWLTFNQVKTE